MYQLYNKFLNLLRNKNLITYPDPILDSPNLDYQLLPGTTSAFYFELTCKLVLREIAFYVEFVQTLKSKMTTFNFLIEWHSFQYFQRSFNPKRKAYDYLDIPTIMYCISIDLKEIFASFIDLKNLQVKVKVPTIIYTGELDQITLEYSAAPIDYLLFALKFLLNPLEFRTGSKYKHKAGAFWQLVALITVPFILYKFNSNAILESSNYQLDRVINKYDTAHNISFNRNRFKEYTFNRKDRLLDLFKGWFDSNQHHYIINKGTVASHSLYNNLIKPNKYANTFSQNFTEIITYSADKDLYKLDPVINVLSALVTPDEFAINTHLVKDTKSLSNTRFPLLVSNSYDSDIVRLFKMFKIYSFSKSLGIKINLNINPECMISSNRLTSHRNSVSLIFSTFLRHLLLYLAQFPIRNEYYKEDFLLGDNLNVVDQPSFIKTEFIEYLNNIENYLFKYIWIKNNIISIRNNIKRLPFNILKNEQFTKITQRNLDWLDIEKPAWRENIQQWYLSHKRNHNTKKWYDNIENWMLNYGFEEDFAFMCFIYGQQSFSFVKQQIWQPLFKLMEPYLANQETWQRFISQNNDKIQILNKIHKLLEGKNQYKLLDNIVLNLSTKWLYQYPLNNLFSDRSKIVLNIPYNKPLDSFDLNSSNFYVDNFNFLYNKNYTDLNNHLGNNSYKKWIYPLDFLPKHVIKKWHYDSNKLTFFNFVHFVRSSCSLSPASQRVQKMSNIDYNNVIYRSPYLLDKSNHIISTPKDIYTSLESSYQIQNRLFGLQTQAKSAKNGWSLVEEFYRYYVILKSNISIKQIHDINHVNTHNYIINYKPIKSTSITKVKNPRSPILVSSRAIAELLSKEIYVEDIEQVILSGQTSTSLQQFKSTVSKHHNLLNNNKLVIKTFSLAPTGLSKYKPWIFTSQWWDFCRKEFGNLLPALWEKVEDYTTSTFFSIEEDDIITKSYKTYQKLFNDFWYKSVGRWIEEIPVLSTKDSSPKEQSIWKSSGLITDFTQQEYSLLVLLGIMILVTTSIFSLIFGIYFVDLWRDSLVLNYLRIQPTTLSYLKEIKSIGIFLQTNPKLAKYILSHSYDKKWYRMLIKGGANLFSDLFVKETIDIAYSDFRSLDKLTSNDLLITEDNISQYAAKLQNRDIFFENQLDTDLHSKAKIDFFYNFAITYHSSYDNRLSNNSIDKHLEQLLSSKRSNISENSPISLIQNCYLTRGFLFVSPKGVDSFYLVKALAATAQMSIVRLSIQHLIDKRGPKPEKEELLYFILRTLSNITIPGVTHVPGLSGIAPGVQLTGRAIRTGKRPTPSELKVWGKKEIKERAQEQLVDIIQFARSLSPCVIWIPDLHQVSSYNQGYYDVRFMLSHLAIELSQHVEEDLKKRVIFIGSTHKPRQVDPIFISRSRLSCLIRLRMPTLRQRQKEIIETLNQHHFNLTNSRSLIRELGARTRGYNSRELAGLSNEILLSAKNAENRLVDIPLIRSAFHKYSEIIQNTPDLDTLNQLFLSQDPSLIYYQVGRAIIYVLFTDPSPINALVAKFSLPKSHVSWLSKTYLEVSSLKSVTSEIIMLPYILGCLAGSATRDAWLLSQGNIEEFSLTLDNQITQDMALCSNLLHTMLSEFPFIDMYQHNSDRYKYNSAWKNYSGDEIELLQQSTLYYKDQVLFSKIDSSNKSERFTVRHSFTFDSISDINGLNRIDNIVISPMPIDQVEAIRHLPLDPPRQPFKRLLLKNDSQERFRLKLESLIQQRHEQVIDFTDLRISRSKYLIEYQPPSDHLIRLEGRTIWNINPLFIDYKKYLRCFHKDLFINADVVKKLYMVSKKERGYLGFDQILTPLWLQTEPDQEEIILESLENGMKIVKRSKRMVNVIESFLFFEHLIESGSMFRRPALGVPMFSFQPILRGNIKHNQNRFNLLFEHNSSKRAYQDTLTDVFIYGVLLESYQYLVKFFLSNQSLLKKITDKLIFEGIVSQTEIEDAIKAEFGDVE